MISLEHGIILSIILFLIGLTGLIIRNNFLFIIISIEIMINAIALLFIVVGSYWNQLDAQIMFILTISFAAAEAGILLSLLIKMYKQYHTLNIDTIHEIHE